MFKWKNALNTNLFQYDVVIIGMKQDFCFLHYLIWMLDSLFTFLFADLVALCLKKYFRWLLPSNDKWYEEGWGVRWGSWAEIGIPRGIRLQGAKLSWEKPRRQISSSREPQGSWNKKTSCVELSQVNLRKPSQISQWKEKSWGKSVVKGATTRKPPGAYPQQRSQAKCQIQGKPSKSHSKAEQKQRNNDETKEQSHTKGRWVVQWIACQSAIL